MAGRIAYYGNIVKDGLVLNLDAAKKDSYPGSGTTWRDTSGNGNNGTLTNGPTFSSTNYGSVVFDGVNDYISTNIRTNILSPSSDFSITCWVYLNINVLNYQVLIYLGNYLVYTPNYNWIGIAINGGNTIQIGNYNNPSEYSLSFTIPSSGWYQIAQIRSGGNHYAYLNGIQKTFGTYVSPSINASSTLRIGNQISNGDYLNGNISNILIYNRALSATEVLQNYNALKGRYGL